MTALRARLAALAERDIVGWRAIRRLGPLRVLRAAAALYLVAHIARIALVDAPYLLDPAQPGTDISTYYAAGQRLRDGHPLFALSPGDYPVPLDPPYTTVPLLSPPLMAVVWRPLASLLPAEIAMGGWFVATFTVFAGTLLWLVRTGGVLRLALMLLLAPALALTALSGDINTVLGPLLVAAWLSVERGRPGRAGAAIAIAAGLKLTPVFFLAWLMAIARGRRGLTCFVAAVGALGAVSLLGAGWDNHVAYLDVIGYTSSAGITPWSVPGILAGFGLGAPFTTLSLVAVALTGLTGVWLARRQAGVAFAMAALAAVYVGPVVHPVTFGLLLSALAPAARPSLTTHISRPAPYAAHEGEPTPSEVESPAREPTAESESG